MADRRFFSNHGPFTLGELTKICEAQLSDETASTLEITDVAPLDTADPEHISFLNNRKYIEQFTQSKAGACIIHPDMAKYAPTEMACLLTPMPHKAYALVAQAFYPITGTAKPAIAPTAVIADTALVGSGCCIEAGVVIGPAVEIGPNCHIKANAVIDQGVTLGEDCLIGSNTTLSHCRLGDRVVIYPGAQIGQRGFGFAIDPTAGFFTVPQLGRVIIGDDVEVGANTTIDRGAGPDTIISNGTRIDNLVQIGHNVDIGQYCVIVAQTGLSGSTKLENFVMMGGQSGSAGHLTIGTGAKIGAQAGVMRNIDPGAEVMGTPSVPLKQFFRQAAILTRMTKKRKK